MTPAQLCTLPSVGSAHALLDGAPDAPILVLRDVATRGAIIAAGAWLAGLPPRQAGIAGLAGAVAIEVAVLAHLAACRTAEPAP
jgi:hypothetical protein